MKTLLVIGFILWTLLMFRLFVQLCEAAEETRAMQPREILIRMPGLSRRELRKITRAVLKEDERRRRRRWQTAA